MTRAYLTRAVGGVLILALGAASLADTPKAAPARGKKYALVVGIGQYADKQIKPRQHAEADAKAVAALLSEKGRFGDAKDVTLLVGKEATRAAFLKALKGIAKQAGPSDTVILSFIGQGGPLGKTGERRCYFLADSTFKGRDKDAVTAEEIEDALKPFAGKNLCALLDIDFTGFVDDGKGRAISEPTLGKAPYREFLGDDGSEDHLPMPGRVAFLATNGLHQSLDLKDHGLFTQVILDALKGEADSEGYEADGQVSVDELTKYLGKRLPELARKHGKTEKQKEQDHFVLAGPSSRFIVARNPKTLEAHQARLAKFEQMVANDKLSAKLADEGRTLLERMPTLKKKQELRKVYQQFIDGKLTAARFDAQRKDITDSMILKQAEADAFAEAVLQAADLIQEKHVKETELGQLAIWAIRGLYRRLEEKIPDDLEAQLKKAKTMPGRQVRTLLAESRAKLGNREDLDGHKDLNLTLQRMLGRLDPYTNYLDPEARVRFDNEVAGVFTGIGALVRKDAATDYLLIVSPIKGSPANRAETPLSRANPKYPRGLFAGDLVTALIRDVDSLGKDLPKTTRTETKGLPLSQVIKLVLGKEDTKITLVVQRDGVKEPFEVAITRGQVEVESAVGVVRKSDDSWDYVLDKKNRIGYIRLTNFARNSARDIEAVMRELVRKEDIKGFVLDLRFNPGGLLTAALHITDLFIDDGVIVSVHPRGGSDQSQSFSGKKRGSLLGFEMVCLINDDSASGSEIVAAALQDHKRAYIVGERSYGKGSVQTTYDFEFRDFKTGEKLLGEIKLTTAAFRRPNGENLNKSSTSGKEDEKWGVVPNKVIPLTSKEKADLFDHQSELEKIERFDRRGKAKKFTDRQLDAAVEYLRGKIGSR